MISASETGIFFAGHFYNSFNFTQKSIKWGRQRDPGNVDTPIPIRHFHFPFSVEF